MRLIVFTLLSSAVLLAHGLLSSRGATERSSRTGSQLLWMGGGFGAKKIPAFQYTGAVVPGKRGIPLEVPQSIQRPDYAADGIPKTKSRGSPWIVTPQTE